LGLSRTAGLPEQRQSQQLTSSLDSVQQNKSGWLGLLPDMGRRVPAPVAWVFTHLCEGHLLRKR